MGIDGWLVFVGVVITPGLLSLASQPISGRQVLALAGINRIWNASMRMRVMMVFSVRVTQFPVLILCSYLCASRR